MERKIKLFEKIRLLNFRIIKSIKKLEAIASSFLFYKVKFN